MANSKNKQEILEYTTEKFEISEYEYWGNFWWYYGSDDDLYNDYGYNDPKNEWVYVENELDYYLVTKHRGIYSMPFKRINSKLINIDMSLPREARRNNRIDFLLGLKKDNYITTIGDYLIK